MLNNETLVLYNPVKQGTYNRNNRIPFLPPYNVIPFTQQALLQFSVLAINASFPTAYDARSLALLGLGNLTGAGQAIDTAISLDPANAHSWQVKGAVLSRSGNYSGATQAYQRSIVINPDYDPAWPGMTNASVDLNQTERRCAAAATQAVPVTTKAGMPVMWP